VQRQKELYENKQHQCSYFEQQWIDNLVRRFGPDLRLVIILNTDSIIYSKKIMHLLMLPVMRMTLAAGSGRLKIN
jgi:membrane glycosyltransferase